MSFSLRREELVQPIFSYLLGAPEGEANVNKGEGKELLALHSSSLILDGTGPRFSVHLPYLNGLGQETISKFDKVVAFSGGIGAYCVFLAYHAHGLNHNIEHYFDAVDTESRKVHKVSPRLWLSFAKKLYFKQPPYSRLCYMDFLRYVFPHSFLNAKLNDIAPNFFPYVALEHAVRPVPINSANGFDRDNITMAEVMAAGMKIPHIYSGPDSALSGSQLAEAYDATYTSGYWPLRQRVAAADPLTVMLTMSDSGIADTACVVNTLKGKKPRYSVAYDIVKLLLNLPNKRYKQDLQLAYLDYVALT